MPRTSNKKVAEWFLRTRNLSIGDRIRVTMPGNGDQYVGILKRVGFALGRIKTDGDDDFSFPFDAGIEKVDDSVPISKVAKSVDFSDDMLIRPIKRAKHKENEL